MTSIEADPASDFQVRIASTGETFAVPGDKSLLFALIERGYRVRSSCSDGRCGTCKVRYLEGEPDHRDSVLEPDERSEYLTVCVSRAKSDELVLDLPAPGAAAAPSDPYALDRPVAVVDAETCVACLTCVRACSFDAARIDAGRAGVGGIMGAAVVDLEECTGCGLCAAACPTGAIAMTRFSDGEVAARVDKALATLAGAVVTDGEPVSRIVAFACPNSLPAARAWSGKGEAVDLEVVEMPCTGRVDPLHVMRAFERGADGVIVAGCEPGRCLFAVGNSNAEKRVRWIGSWLDEVGLSAKRARMAHLPEEGAERFAAAVTEHAVALTALGPSPVRLARLEAARESETPGEARPAG